MRRNVAYPHLVLPEDCVRFRGFMVGTFGEPLSIAGGMLDGWDYDRPLEAAVRVDVDFNAASAALGIPPEELRLDVRLKAGTGAGSLPRRMESLGGASLFVASSTAEISARIDASRLSGRLYLECAICLGAVPARPRTILSPASVAARLWSAETDLTLEDGASSRFPVELASFSRIFAGQPHASAPWFVQWRPQSLEADFGGAVRLFVNSDHSELAARFASGDASTLQAMLGDLISQIVESAVKTDGVDDIMRHAEEGTIARQVENWLGLAFPGRDAAWVRDLAVNSPGNFRSAILAVSECD